MLVWWKFNYVNIVRIISTTPPIHGSTVLVSAVFNELVPKSVRASVPSEWVSDVFRRRNTSCRRKLEYRVVSNVFRCSFLAFFPCGFLAFFPRGFLAFFHRSFLAFFPRTSVFYQLVCPSGCPRTVQCRRHVTGARFT